MGKEFWGLAKRITMMVEKLIFGAGVVRLGEGGRGNTRIGKWYLRLWWRLGRGFHTGGLSGGWESWGIGRWTIQRYGTGWRNIVPVIPTENTIRKRVKSEERRWAKRMYEKYRDIYKKRYIVEQVFSVVKRRYDDRVLTKNQGVAELHTLAMFALYNLELLFSLYFSPLSHIYLLTLFRTKKINFFNTLKNQLKNLIIYS